MSVLHETDSTMRMHWAPALDGLDNASASAATPSNALDGT